MRFTTCQFHVLRFHPHSYDSILIAHSYSWMQLLAGFFSLVFFIVNPTMYFKGINSCNFDSPDMSTMPLSCKPFDEDCKIFISLSILWLNFNKKSIFVQSSNGKDLSVLGELVKLAHSSSDSPFKPAIFRLLENITSSDESHCFYIVQISIGEI